MAVVFDLDGTLIDSAPDIINAVNDVLVGQGYNTVEPAVLHSRIGLPATELFSSVRRIDIDEMVERFRDRLRTTYIDKTRPFPGALDLIDAIRDAGWRIGVATTKPTDLANRALRGAGLAHAVDFVQGSEDLPTKPNPAVIHACLNGLSATSGWMVGDRVEDVIAGRRAGLRTVAVCQGSQVASILNAQRPTMLVEDLGELLAKLPTVLNEH